MGVLVLAIVADFGVAIVACAGAVDELGGVGHLTLVIDAGKHVLGGTSVLDTTPNAVRLAHDFDGPLAGGSDDVLSHEIAEDIGLIRNQRIGGAATEPVAVNDAAVVATPPV